MNRLTAIILFLSVAHVAFCLWRCIAERRRERKQREDANRLQAHTSHLHVWERIPVGLVEVLYEGAALKCEADLLHCPCGATRVVEPVVRMLPPRTLKRRGRGRA